MLVLATLVMAIGAALQAAVGLSLALRPVFGPDRFGDADLGDLLHLVVDRLPLLTR